MVVVVLRRWSPGLLLVPIVISSLVVLVVPLRHPIVSPVVHDCVTRLLLVVVPLADLVRIMVDLGNVRLIILPWVGSHCLCVAGT